MLLIEYLAAERGRQSATAAAAGIAPAFLSQIAVGARPAPPERCADIERACGYLVMRWDLRPTDWHRIWPELIGADGAPDVPEPVTQPGALDEVRNAA